MAAKEVGEGEQKQQLLYINSTIRIILKRSMYAYAKSSKLDMP
jgi:hypothetical protein